MECTAEDCDTQATLYLCEHHRLELKDLLDGVDFLIVNLDPLIQSGKVTRKVGGQEGSNGGKAGSKPPTTDTQLTRYWLWQLPRDAYKEARDNPTAGHTLHMARIWVTNARQAVYGQETEAQRPPEETWQKLKANAPAMTAKDCAEWLSKHTGIHFTSKRIRNWVTRRGLKPHTTDGHPTYRPEEVLHAYHQGERDIV